MEQPSSPPYLLFADDDAALRTAYSEFFHKAGWRYDIVPDGAAALAAASDHDYDVVVTDLVMPGLDGLELLRSLRQRKPGQAIIVTTSNNTAECVIQFLREGAVDFIPKPIDLTFLERSVSRVVACVRQRQWEDRYYRFVESEETSIVMDSRSLASGRMPLSIVHRLQRAGTISLNTQLKLELAFHEALANALEHGNLELDSKWREEFDERGEDRYTAERRRRLNMPKYNTRKIAITTSYKNGVLTLKVRDQGPGFKQTGRSSRKKKEELLCSGRGLTIIAGSVDQVKFGANGREITMLKKLEPEEA